MTRGWHFLYVRDWIPSLGIRYHVAIDGISLWLVLLTTFITPIAAYASFGSIKTRIKELCFAYLLLQAAMIGAFVSLDLFLFYVFWELMLVPMYLMIGIWGGADKIKAAFKFFIYTMTGSVLMLAAMIYLVWQYTKLTGSPSFDLLALQRVLLPPLAQKLCFWAFAIAFFIKVPMFPVHTWLPDAHVQAPPSAPRPARCCSIVDETPSCNHTALAAPIAIGPRRRPLRRPRCGGTHRPYRPPPDLGKGGMAAFADTPPTRTPTGVDAAVRRSSRCQECMEVARLALFARA